MTSSSIPRTKAPGAKKWLMALAVTAPVAFLASIPWLQEQADGLVYLFAGLAAMLTVVSSFAIAVMEEQGMDEWHRAASRFAGQWGWLAGGGTVALLLALPPVHRIVIAASSALSGAVDPDPTLVLMAFTLGFMAVVFAQMLCTVVLSVAWRTRKSRAE